MEIIDSTHEMFGQINGTFFEIREYISVVCPKQYHHEFNGNDVVLSGPGFKISSGYQDSVGMIYRVHEGSIDNILRFNL